MTLVLVCTVCGRIVGKETTDWTCPAGGTKLSEGRCRPEMHERKDSRNGRHEKTNPGHVHVRGAVPHVEPGPLQ